MTVAERLIAITGCQAIGQVGDLGVHYWSLIDDSETSNWQEFDSNNTPAWALVGDTQAASWQNIGNSQTPTWGAIDNAESADWELIPSE